MTDDTLSDIARLHRLTSILLRKLEEQLIAPNLAELNIQNHVWSEKEDAISILTKLTQILTKLEPLQHEMAEEAEMEPITEDDIAMLKRYMEKQHDAS